MIVATAGHVDHGKTTLIKALTGTDTTHLPEESQRGMTIDLGFAGLGLPGGDFIGFVDVPGHERFTRNMLAGITGVDLALLIVASLWYLILTSLATVGQHFLEASLSHDRVGGDRSARRPLSARLRANLLPGRVGSDDGLLS